MDYENRHCHFSEKLPIKDRNYSYYMISNKTKKDYYNNSCLTHPCINDENNNNNLVTTNMRMSNFESRLNTMEKMMKYFDEFIHLKEEEKMNNLTSLEISSAIPSNINDLIKKINKLENEVNEIKKQKQLSEMQNAKKIEDLKNKINYLQQVINNNKLNIDINKNNLFERNNNMSNDNNNSKMLKLNISNLSEQAERDKFNKNILDIDEIIQKKLNEIYNNNKISEMLLLIEDINKIAEDNEFNINEQNENIRKIQNDNLTLIKVVAIHSEKINSIDYLMNELTNLKNKYFKLLTLAKNVHEENEEAISQNEMNERFKENNNQNEINNIENYNKNTNENINNDN
jgi:outer membrane murein-binding lipoprotein Lpp